MNRRDFLGTVGAVTVVPWSHFRVRPIPKNQIEELSIINQSTKALGLEDTVLECLYPENVFPGDILHFPRTGENVWVAPDGKLVRGIGGPARKILDDEIFWVIGSAERVKEARCHLQVRAEKFSPR